MLAPATTSSNRCRLLGARVSTVVLTLVAVGGGVLGTSNIATAAPATTPASCVAGPTYTVVGGDSWFGIAKAVQVQVAALLTANSATPTRVIWPGQVLCLPEGAVLPPPAQPVPAAGDAAVPAPDTTCATTYTVVGGDSWFRIAGRVGVRPADLAKANDASFLRVLQAGDQLCLPPGATPPVAPAPAPSAPAAPDPAAPSACGGSYTVVSGDSWFGIANRVGVKAAALAKANDSTFLRVLQAGDVLCLPPGATLPAAAPSAVQAPAAPAPTPAPETCVATYVVRSGDSWFGIAGRAGISARTLSQANDATPDKALHPGDELCLPPGSRSLVDPVNGEGFVTLAALPLQGPCGYGDTWGAFRGVGRTHEGTDMFSVTGQYVYAVADGTLTRKVWDQPGSRSGNAWWLRSADGSGTSFFYAHLMDFAPGLEVGSRVKAGQIIGYLGSTGNAAGPHLHFEIHPYGGPAINPYQSLKAAGGCKAGDAYTQPDGSVPAPVGKN
jgi:LysM repeat protein